MNNEPLAYDAGILNDFGGGDVSWWHDYIRSELERAHEYYAAQVGAVEVTVLPADVIESLLAIGHVEWGQTHTQTDGKHIDDLEDTLRLTREHFGIKEKETAMHGVYLAGTGTVLAHTGMSPNSPQHARILTGAWNQLVDIAQASKNEVTEE